MKIAKILTLGFLAVGAWIANWILLKQTIYQGESLIFMGWPSLATILGITFLTFFLLTNKNRIVSLILDLLILAGYIIVMPKSLYVILGGVIFFGFLILFEQRLASEEKSRLDFSIRRVMMGSISLTIYALLLLIGLNVYYNTQTDFTNNPDAYYVKLELAARRVADRTVPYYTKAFDQQLNEAQKQQMSDLVAKEAVDKIKESAGSYQQYLPFILAIIVIGLLSSFAFLLRWATVIVSWGIFRILVAVKFFKLEKEMVEVQKLTIQ